MRLQHRTFQNRFDAGRRLADALGHLAGEDTLVLALPRGGVPVAFEIAQALQADLDVLLVRKLGAPGHEELALGALVDGPEPQLVLNDDIIREASPPPHYLEAARQQALAEIARRRALYAASSAGVAAAIAGRVALVVDDGIATGATVKAAIKGARAARPARLVLAIPVAPQGTLDALRPLCDEVVCVATPDPFYAVGLAYEDFTQTSDDEVLELLRRARA